jgi:hypothetical protein
MSVAAGSTIEVAGTVGNIGTIGFSGTGGELRLDHPGGVTGTLVNWAIGDEMALPSATGYTVAVNDGTLDVSRHGALLSAFIVGSSYSAGDFLIVAGASGVLIGPPVVNWTNAGGGAWGNAAKWSSSPTEPGATVNVAISWDVSCGVVARKAREHRPAMIVFGRPSHARAPVCLPRQRSCRQRSESADGGTL